MIFFGLFWSAMVLLFDGLTVVPVARQILSMQFPSTDGTILSFTWTLKPSGDYSSFHQEETEETKFFCWTTFGLCSNNQRAFA